MEEDDDDDDDDDNYLFDMPCPPYTHLALYADDTVLLSQSWRPNIISRTFSHAVTTLLKYFTKWKLRLNAHKNESILFSKRQHPLPKPLQIHDTFVTWSLCRSLFRPCARFKTSLQ